MDRVTVLQNEPPCAEPGSQVLQKLATNMLPIAYSTAYPEATTPRESRPKSWRCPRFWRMAMLSVAPPTPPPPTPPPTPSTPPTSQLGPPPTPPPSPPRTPTPLTTPAPPTAVNNRMQGSMHARRITSMITRLSGLPCYLAAAPLEQQEAPRHGD
ncbi:hypothetical protein F4861DRAFT_97999 [Xylaria intraflava]|nr:hypothetical protein F4861DRAFT_97999 [Xylaria intraflava]